MPPCDRGARNAAAGDLASRVEPVRAMAGEADRGRETRL